MQKNHTTCANRRPRGITRREAVRLLGSASVGAWFAASERSAAASAAADNSTPLLAPGTPTSPERTALIDAFRKQSEGLRTKFEAHKHKSDLVMPYRLFRPEAAGKLPLVVYLHGSGGLGDANERQLGLGNVFGTHLWLLPENQKNFPCFVAVPQTDRGWARYGFSEQPRGRRRCSRDWETGRGWPWNSSMPCAASLPSMSAASTSPVSRWEARALGI